MTLVEAERHVEIEAPVREAGRLLASGDTAASLALLEPLIATDPPLLPAQFLLSMTAWQMGRLDWAVELMQDCHERWPMEPTVAEALASLYAQAGNLAESLYMGKIGTALGGPGDALSALVPERFPSFDWAFLAIKEKPLLAQARLALAGGKLADAAEKARQHIALDGGAPDGLEFYASTLLRAGRASEAAEALGALGETDPAPAVLASLQARALAAVGEIDAARRWHAQATASAPDDATIAAACVADGVWLEPDASRLAAAAAAWAQRFCPRPKPRQWCRGEGKLTIAYVVSAFADPLDTAAVAAVARAHDRATVRVVGYGTGAQASPENAVLSGAFDTWQDIGTIDAPTLARFFARDGNHVIVDASGFAAPRSLLALARVPTAIRVSWLGNGSALGHPVYDFEILAESGRAGETSWRIAGCYPVLQPLKSVQPAARNLVHFGADIRMPQFDAETVAAWSAILRGLGQSRLLLRANDADRRNIDRLVGRFGPELAARIDIVAAERAEEFYALVDIALAPRRGVSPRLAAEAVGCGVPVVAFAGASPAEPYGGFLRDLDLGAALVAGDERDYVGIALALAASAPERERLRAGLQALGQGSARRFAQALEDHAARALAEWQT